MTVILVQICLLYCLMPDNTVYQQDVCEHYKAFGCCLIKKSVGRIKLPPWLSLICLVSEPIILRVVFAVLPVNDQRYVCNKHQC